MDIAQSRDYQIDVDSLARELGAPVVPMVAKNKEDNKGLLQAIVAAFEGKTAIEKVKLFYGNELEEHIKELETIIARDEELSQRFPPRWLAIKLLEEDREVLEKVGLDR